MSGATIKNLLKNKRRNFRTTGQDISIFITYFQYEIEEKCNSVVNDRGIVFRILLCSLDSLKLSNTIEIPLRIIRSP
jgi:uncharacterized membrane protein YvbJ